MNKKTVEDKLTTLRFRLIAIGFSMFVIFFSSLSINFETNLEFMIVFGVFKLFLTHWFLIIMTKMVYLKVKNGEPISKNNIRAFIMLFALNILVLLATLYALAVV